MFSLIQVLVSVALLSFVLGSPVTEGNVIGGLALNMPGGGGEGGGNLPIDFGKEASRGQFSHHVLVREAGISGRRVPYCGGSIISNRFVLTAAVCKVSGVPNEAVDVVVGVHNYDADNHITYKVNEWIVHDEYYRQVSAITSIIVRNDIALIKTDKPIEFNDVIAPIALHHDFFVGEEPVLLSGWSQVSVSLQWHQPRDHDFNYNFFESCSTDSTTCHTLIWWQWAIQRAGNFSKASCLRRYQCMIGTLSASHQIPHLQTDSAKPITAVHWWPAKNWSALLRGKWTARNWFRTASLASAHTSTGSTRKLNCHSNSVKVKQDIFFFDERNGQMGIFQFHPSDSNVLGWWYSYMEILL